MSISSASRSAWTSGTSPDRTRISPALSGATAIAARTASAVPSGVGWRAKSASSAKTSFRAAVGGEYTTSGRRPLTSRAAARTKASIGRPHNSCRILGRRVFIRIPRPAARITGRTPSEVWLIASDGSTEPPACAPIRDPSSQPLTGPPSDCLDLQQRIAWQSGDLDRAAGRRRLDHVLAVDGVHLREMGEGYEEDVRLDHVGHRQSGGSENGLEVEESPFGLLLDASE